MVFHVTESSLYAYNFLFFSYIFIMNFLFFQAQNIYFVPKCTGQPADAKYMKTCPELSFITSEGLGENILFHGDITVFFLPNRISSSTGLCSKKR